MSWNSHFITKLSQIVQENSGGHPYIPWENTPSSKLLTVGQNLALKNHYLAVISKSSVTSEALRVFGLTSCYMNTSFYPK